MARMQSVQGSSFISGAGYDPDSQTLTLQFSDGKTWEYRGVDDGTYNEMMQSDSMGRFFHARIKGQYTGKRA